MQIRTFLINKTLNGRGWKANAASLAKNILSFIGKPLILKRYPNGRIDHRDWNSSLSASKNLQEQEANAIGRIAHVYHDTSSDNYYADIDITNQEAENWLRARNSSKVPIAVSPQIIYDSRKEFSSDIRHWFGSHLAIVDVGAYGPQAIAVNFCEGECPVDLPIGANASFDFEIATALNAALFDTSLVESNRPDTCNNTMSMVEVKPETNQGNTNNNSQPEVLNPAQQKQTAYFQDAPQNKSPISPPSPEAKPEAPKEQNIDYKALADQLKSELDSAKVKIAENQTVRDTLTEHEKKLAKYEEEGKTRAVREAIPIFLPEFLDKKGNINGEAVDAKTKELLKRGFTAEDVKYMYQPAVEAWEKSMNAGANPGEGGCSCGANNKAANASIYQVPTTDDPNAQVTQVTPWFVDAARLMRRERNNFSKQPGRLL